MAATIYYQAADYILSALGITPTSTNVNLLVAWMPNEYSASQLAATNNPLATSQSAAGQVGYCYIPGAGQSSEPCYDTLAHGSAACAQTIANGLYPSILAGLRNSDTVTFFASPAEFSLWSGGSPGYMERIQSNYASLPTPPSWAVTSTGGGVTNPPVGGISGVPAWLLWVGGGALVAGLGIGLWWLNDRGPVTGFARRRDETHMDARVDPKWMEYVAPTGKDISEIAEPLSACNVDHNLKAALERAGIPVLEDRNLPEGVEAMYIPPDPKLPQFPKGRIMRGVHGTRQAEKCLPYGVQLLFHEGGHSITHNPDCLPMYRGVSYESRGHQVEEQESELIDFASMVMSGLPVETYEGVVYPAGTEEIDWGMAQRNLHPETYTNVKWATELLVRAGQGDTDALVGATCPLSRISA